MKRFLVISTFLHAIVLLLLFSWEIPLADRLPPRSVVEVSLIERIEGRGEEKKEEGDKKAKQATLKKKDIQEEKDEKTIHQAPRVIPEAKEERRVEELKPEKVEPIGKEIIEEKPESEEEIPSEPFVLKAQSEEILALRTNLTPPNVGGGETGDSMSSLMSVPPSGGRGEGGAPFLASAGLESGKEGIALGGGKGPGAGQGEGGNPRFASLQKSSGEGDSVIAEIMRRIERAKLYPRIARKMGIEGQSTVRFRLKPNGKVESVELVGSSGSDILDQASLETVQRAAPLPYKEGWLKVVIIFKIL